MRMLRRTAVAHPPCCCPRIKTWHAALLTGPPAAQVYEAWYDHEHQAVELQKEAVYGLTEIFREEVRGARLIANPGCYPTSVQLPLVPLIRKGLISTEDIIIDAKSGEGQGVAAIPPRP